MHIPVLLNQVMEYLQPRPNQSFIDCTVGGGGHALGLLSLIEPKGKLLGIDLSKEAIGSLEFKAQNLKLSQRFILVIDNFAHLKEIAKRNNFSPVNGILLDLGLSSDLLEESGRGFSFMRDEKLDMRYNPDLTDLTAEKIVNQYPEQELIEIFKRYGGERFSRRVGKKIAQVRAKQKIDTTIQLKEIVKSALGKYFHTKSLARIFQSLRIAVNNELENLKQGLLNGVDVLAPQGRIVVISYHSLEDKIVKDFFKEEGRLKILTKKPVQPSKGEVEKNRRCRSAKLRAAEKI